MSNEPPGPPRLSGAALDRYLDSVLIGGREPFTPVVTDYDPAWPARFAEVEARLRSALGDAALAVEHIGSTSVPGLAAKPIIDVLVVVADVEEESYVPAVEEAGFVLRVREAGHRMFRTPGRDVHVHVYPDGAQAISDYRDLRDWLRVDAPDRALYADVKRDLATRAWSDMNHYAEAKTEVIQQVLARARASGAAADAAGPDERGGRLRVGGADAGLDTRLSAELDRYNVAATGIGDQRELTVRVLDEHGELLGGMSGWTWGTCAGLGMAWVREDARRAGWGSRLLAAAEAEAVARGCTQMVLSSFTFQAPGFYLRHGYVETGRTEGLPVAGMADVHFRKDLTG